MSIKGFSVGGSVQRYDFNYLDNKPAESIISPVEKTSAMTQEVGMDDEGKLWTEPGSGGGSSPYDSNPAALGTASPGSSSNYARGDHVHPKPSAADLGITVPSAATATPSNLGTAAVGTSTKYAREDHVHNKPTYTASDVGAIATPSSPTTGQFLKWNGSAWVASDLPLYNGGVS